MQLVPTCIPSVAKRHAKLNGAGTLGFPILMEAHVLVGVGSTTVSAMHGLERTHPSQSLASTQQHNSCKYISCSGVIRRESDQNKGGGTRTIFVPLG